MKVRDQIRVFMKGNKQIILNTNGEEIMNSQVFRFGVTKLLSFSSYMTAKPQKIYDCSFIDNNWSNA